MCSLVKVKLWIPTENKTLVTHHDQASRRQQVGQPCAGLALRFRHLEERSETLHGLGSRDAVSSKGREPLCRRTLPAPDQETPHADTRPALPLNFRGVVLKGGPRGTDCRCGEHFFRRARLPGSRLPSVPSFVFLPGASEPTGHPPLPSSLASQVLGAAGTDIENSG